jgi:predicted enzyme related to lactoylglutathione lyase
MATLTLAHFEITGDDVPGLARFYGTLLGWEQQPVPFVDDYTMLLEDGADGMSGAVMRDANIAQPAIVWFGTPDIDASIAAVIAGGGSRFNDVHALPDGRKVVYMRDPAGNLFGLTQDR